MYQGKSRPPKFIGSCLSSIQFFPYLCWGKPYKSSQSSAPRKSTRLHEEQPDSVTRRAAVGSPVSISPPTVSCVKRGGMMHLFVGYFYRHRLGEVTQRRPLSVQVSALYLEVRWLMVTSNFGTLRGPNVLATRRLDKARKLSQ